MHILLTNDDGYEADGLAVLYDAVRALPEVTLSVIAPKEPQSGRGHTVSGEIRSRQVERAPLGRIRVVEGSSADCVRCGVCFPGWPRPDWVIAGINHGGNLGIDVYYSGTVSAAREAAILGVPAIAVSQVIKAPVPLDWPRAAREVTAVVAALMGSCDAPPGADRQIFDRSILALRRHREGRIEEGRPSFWNVNLPCRPPAGHVPDIGIVPVSADPLHMVFEANVDPDGTERLRNVASYHDRPAAPGSDVAVAFGGAISISQILC